MQTAALIEQLGPRARLHRAVHRHKALTLSGLHERLFTLLFSGLVYPQIWEDPEVDLEAMALTPSSRVVTIASGGCNVMSYLTGHPASITAVDLNPAHVALTRLKLAAAAHLPNYEYFRRFFSEADRADNIAAYRQYIRANLDDTTRRYWEQRSILGSQRIVLFRQNFYRFGLLGRFIGAAHIAARIFGIDFSDLLRAQSVNEQRDFFETRVAPVFEHKVTRWVLDQPASLFGLGIPPSQFRALAEGREMHDVIKERLERLICGFPLSENYFAWQAFARHYQTGPTGSLPRYLQPAHFDAIRANHGRAQILNLSLTEFLRDAPNRSFDCFVLLDAQDWMTDAQLWALWDEITRTAQPGARVIFRTAGVASILPHRLSANILDRWRYHDEESRALTLRDRSAIYGGFHRYSFVEYS